MLWVCNNIIVMLCVTMINIKIEQFELSFPASSDLLKVKNRNSRKKLWNMFKVNDKDTRTISMTSLWCFYCWLRTYFTPSSSVYCWLWTIIFWLKLNDQWKLFKVDTYGTKTRCLQQKVSILERCPLWRGFPRDKTKMKKNS